MKSLLSSSESRPAPPKALATVVAGAAGAGGLNVVVVGLNGLKEEAFNEAANGFGLNSWISEMETSQRILLLVMSSSTVSHAVVFIIESDWESSWLNSESLVKSAQEAF